MGRLTKTNFFLLFKKEKRYGKQNSEVHFGKGRKDEANHGKAYLKYGLLLGRARAFGPRASGNVSTTSTTAKNQEAQNYEREDDLLQRRDRTCFFGNGGKQ